MRSGPLLRLARDLPPRRASRRCRSFQYAPVIDPVFEDRNLDRDPFDLLVAERSQPRFAVRKRLSDVSGYCNGHIMGFGRFFHSCRYIDRAAVDAYGPFGVALLAEDDLAAMQTDPKTRDNAE